MFATVGAEAGRRLWSLELEHLSSHRDADIGVAACVVVPVIADLLGHAVVIKLKGHLVGAVGLVRVDDRHVANELRILLCISDRDLPLNNRRLRLDHAAGRNDKR